MLDVVRHLEFPVSEPQFPVSFPNSAVDVPSPRVAVLPVSRWRTKDWPAEHFVDLCAKLSSDGINVFLLGGADDKVTCAQIAARVDGVRNMAGETSLVQLGSLLAAMDVVVSNDSGPMQMAVAAGTPVVALFGPTDPTRTGPYGTQHRILTAKCECRPCFSRKCLIREPRCMNDIAPAEVAAAVGEIMGR
jgi:heptosyltransferase-1